jgi:hypothetical protein
MGDFQESLTFAGRSKLWPYQPKWTSDDQLKTKFCRLARMPLHLLQPSCVQENLDTAHRHVLHLIKKNGYNNKSITKPCDEWATLLLEPCGWIWSNQVSSTSTSTSMEEEEDQITANAFVVAYTQSGRGQLISNYHAPSPSIPRHCSRQSCQKLCESVCDCGEAYCSQLCLKRDWKNHQNICEQVYENGFLRSTLNTMEMRESLSKKDYQQALGIFSQNDHVIIDGAKKKRLNGLECVLTGIPFNPTRKSKCTVVAIDTTKYYKSGDEIKVELSAIVPFPKNTTAIDQMQQQMAAMMGRESNASSTTSGTVMLHKCSAQGCKKVECCVKEFKSCGRCKVARYCSGICQKSDWKSHKKTCKAPEK